MNGIFNLQKWSFHLPATKTLCSPYFTANRQLHRTSFKASGQNSATSSPPVAELPDLDELRDKINLNAKFLEQKLNTCSPKFHPLKALLNLQIKQNAFYYKSIKELVLVKVQSPRLFTADCKNNIKLAKNIESTIRSYKIPIDVQVTRALITFSIPEMSLEYREKLSKTAQLFYNEFVNKARYERNSFVSRVQEFERTKDANELKRLEGDAQAIFTEACSSWLKKSDEIRAEILPKAIGEQGK